MTIAASRRWRRAPEFNLHTGTGREAFQAVRRDVSARAPALQYPLRQRRYQNSCVGLARDDVAILAQFGIHLPKELVQNREVEVCLTVVVVNTSRLAVAKARRSWMFDVQQADAAARVCPRVRVVEDL